MADANDAVGFDAGVAAGLSKCQSLIAENAELQRSFARATDAENQARVELAAARARIERLEAALKTNVQGCCGLDCPEPCYPCQMGIDALAEEA